MRSFLLFVFASLSYASVLPPAQTDRNLLLTWGSPNFHLESDNSNFISPHVERLQYLCDVFIGRTQLHVSVDAQSHDLDDISSENVSRRVSEIYAQEEIHISRPPTVRCRLSPNHISLDETQDHSISPVSQLRSPCPHSSLHRRIGFGFINILDLLSVLGVVLLASVASCIASFRKRRSGTRPGQPTPFHQVESGYTDQKKQDLYIDIDNDSHIPDLYHDQPDCQSPTTQNPQSRPTRSRSNPPSDSHPIRDHKHARYTSWDNGHSYLHHQLPSLSAGDSQVQEALRYLDSKLQ